MVRSRCLYPCTWLRPVLVTFVDLSFRLINFVSPVLRHTCDGLLTASVITFGIFLASCVNFGTNEHQRDNSGSWRIPLGVGFIWPLILAVGILFFPETPRYVYRKGRKEEAKATMMKVYGAPANHFAIHVELEEIEQKLLAEEAQRSVIGEWIHMFSAPKMLYRIALGMGLQMFQQLTGANYVSPSRRTISGHVLTWISSSTTERSSSKPPASTTVT